MISVIFSTYNGELTLPVMLEALLQIDEPKGGWEIIAVNNNSTDGTEIILNKYKNKLPLSIYMEYKKGKNNALNSVLKHIRGDLVVFTDDDIIPSKDWLKIMRDVVDRHKEYSIFGGKIIPSWPIPKNNWNDEWINKGIVYAITPDELAQGEVLPGNIWGPNMAIRSEIFKLGYAFDGGVGPDGSTSYKMGSETSFTRKLNKEGYLCWHEPTCIVQHIIKEPQMSKKWVLGRATRFGKGAAIRTLSHPDNQACKKIYGVPKYFFNLLFKEYLRLFSSYAKRNKENAFKARWQINYYIGLIGEIFRYNYKK